MTHTSVSPEMTSLADDLSQSNLIMDYQFELLRKSFTNEIDTSTILNLDNYSQDWFQSNLSLADSISNQAS